MSLDAHVWRIRNPFRYLLCIIKCVAFGFLMCRIYVSKYLLYSRRRSLLKFTRQNSVRSLDPLAAEAETPPRAHTVARIMATLFVIAPLLARAPPEPQPVPGRGLLKGEAGAMHAWYCGQPGNEEALPCLMQQLRSMPTGPERDALQLKIREAPKPSWGRGIEGKGGGGDGAAQLGPQGRDVFSTMHEGWCALKENAESALCLKWREAAQRRQAAAEEKRGHPPHHKSEYVDMHAAYCDENPANAETFPCLTHRLKASTPSKAERDRLMAQLTAVSPTDRMSQREEMLRFWCEDNVTDRKESGVCLSWLKKTQLKDLHDPDGNPRQVKVPRGKGGEGGEGGGKWGGEGGRRPKPERRSAAEAKAEAQAQRGEIERMHEWYCTSLDGTHDTALCARWRLRLKGAVDAYDAVAREKDEKAVKEMAQAHGEKMRELQQKLHAAKEQAAAEETARLEAALKRARAPPPNLPLPPASLCNSHYPRPPPRPTPPHPTPTPTPAPPHPTLQHFSS